MVVLNDRLSPCIHLVPLYHWRTLLLGEGGSHWLLLTFHCLGLVVAGLLVHGGGGDGESAGRVEVTWCGLVVRGHSSG